MKHDVISRQVQVPEQKYSQDQKKRLNRKRPWHIQPPSDGHDGCLTRFCETLFVGWALKTSETALNVVRYPCWDHPRFREFEVRLWHSFRRDVVCSRP
ncbi:hypothetical protein BRAS3843_450030 [Bradyrhizobium sp. STM 3843]|nr:hypothetical protein BRAS3843_450030 [Bradyrhizobium sp. STM 3843]